MLEGFKTATSAGSYKHGNELSSSLKGVEFIISQTTISFS
jgi:hypothetical protein